MGFPFTCSKQCCGLLDIGCCTWRYPCGYRVTWLPVTSLQLGLQNIKCNHFKFLTLNGVTVLYSLY